MWLRRPCGCPMRHGLFRCLQLWHADGEHLFHRTGHSMLPPHCINAFIPLVDAWRLYCLVPHGVTAPPTTAWLAPRPTGTSLARAPCLPLLSRLHYWIQSLHCWTFALNPLGLSLLRTVPPSSA